jgi:hypothetical protein
MRNTPLGPNRTVRSIQRLGARPAPKPVRKEALSCGKHRLPDLRLHPHPTQTPSNHWIIVKPVSPRTAQRLFRSTNGHSPRPLAQLSAQCQVREAQETRLSGVIWHLRRVGSRLEPVEAGRLKRALESYIAGTEVNVFCAFMKRRPRPARPSGAEVWKLTMPLRAAVKPTSLGRTKEVCPLAGIGGRVVAPI